MGVPGAKLGLLAFGPGTDEPLLPAPVPPLAPPAALHIVVKPTTIIAIRIFVFIIVSCSRPKRFNEEEPGYFDPVESNFGPAAAHCFDQAVGNFDLAAARYFDPAEPYFGPALAHYFDRAKLYFGLASERCFDRAELQFGPALERCFDSGSAHSGPATGYFAPVALHFAPAACRFERAEANS
jgi:hypothetical protein